MRKRTMLFPAALIGGALIVLAPTAAQATECVPDPGQEYIAPTYGEAPVLEPAVDAWTEVIPAQDAVYGEPPVLDPGQPYIAPTYGEPPLITPAQDAWDEVTDPGQPYIAPTVVHHEAVVQNEQLYRHWITGKEKWSHVPLGLGWVPLDCWRDIVVTEAWDEVTDPGQEYIPPTVVHHDAIEAVYGEPPVLDPGQEYIAPTYGDAPLITPAVPEQTIEHPAIPAVYGEAPVLDPGQEYIAPTVCEQPAEPTNPVDPTDEGDDTPVIAPVAAPAPAVAQDDASPTPAAATADDELAHTGSDAGLGALAAAGAIVLGGAAVAVRTRARHRA